MTEVKIKSESTLKSTEVQSSSTTKKTKKEKDYAISISQYLLRSPVAIDKYSRAYHESTYRGILKSSKEWEKELKGKG